MEIAFSGIRPLWPGFLVTSSEGGFGESIKGRKVLIKQLLRIMKLTGILLVVACLHLSAKGVGQKVTYSAKNVSLQEVFKEVIKQTGFSIIYNEKLIQNAKPVDIDVRNASVEDVLAICFKDQPFKFTLKGSIASVEPLAVDLNSTTNAPRRVFTLFPTPPITIRGRIVNEKGEPVVASITIKGTNIGTTSNIDGHFQLTNVDENATIVVSGVNIETKEIKVAGRTDLGNFVTNAKISEGEEITVTAYGIEKRTKELGYSVAKITGEELNRTNLGNIFTGLAGKVSGLVISNQGVGMNPENNIMLRGIRSINGSANNQPLIILNGSPLSFGADQNAATMAIDFINSLNPNDIDNVTVLKGANGSAMYGPEGVNGVIIITTKKGGNKRLNVNFRTSTNFQQINWRQRKIQETFGSGEMIDNDGNPIYSSTSDMLWGPAYDGKMVPLGRPDENGEVQMVPYRYTADRQKFWDVARITQNNLSFSQADNNSDFYLGLNYTDQTGILPKDKQSKVGVLLNTGRSFNGMSIRFNMGYNYTNSDKGPSTLNTDFVIPHVPLLSYKDYINYKWADRNHYYSDVNPNPYEFLENNRNKGAEHALTGNLEFKLRPFSWLTITERPGITFNSLHNKTTSKPLDYSDYAKELGANGRSISYMDRKARMSEKMMSMFSVNNDLLLSGIHNAGNFSIKTTLGNTVRQNFMKDLRGIASELTLLVYNLQFGERDYTFPNERSQLSRFYSFFGTAMVGYKDKVFVEITGRNDWDSKLAVAARNKNFYSGANTSIVLNELLPFLQELHWLTGARLRASVTRTANMNIQPYQAERLLQSQGWIGNEIGYGYMSNIPNPLIKPENVISQEYGGNFSFLDNKVNIDIAYYRQRNNGLILNVVNSIYSGSSTTDNAGVYDNWGWEFDINFRQLFKGPGGLTGKGGIRLAINDNKVVSLPPVYNDQITAYVSNIQVVARTGSHAFGFGIRDWKRDPQGRIIVDEFTGIPQLDYENSIVAGRTLPKYTASANLNLEWKRFSFSALAEYRGGNEQYNENGSQGMRMGRSLLTTYNNREPFVVPNSVYEDGNGGYVENKSIKIASIRDYYFEASWANSYFLINAGFFTLRELSLAYDIDLRLKQMKRISVGCYGRDLITVYAKNNIYGDPQLVRGPGSEREKGVFSNSAAGSQANYGSASSDYDRLPGMIQYGFFVNIGL